MAWLDRLTAAFKSGGQTRLPIAAGFTGVSWPWHDTGGGENYAYDRAVREGFLGNPIVQRSVRLVSEGIGQAPIKVSDPALAGLIAGPGSGRSLLEDLATHVLLHGNGYVQVIKDGAGQPVDLFALRPDRITLMPGHDGWPTHAEYRTGDRIVELAFQDERGWPNLIHVKCMHPLDDHYGASALRAAWPATAIHNAASHWNRSLLENAARPSGALVYQAPDGAGLTQAQFDRLKAELTQAYAGSGNAGRPMLLDGGLSWQNLSLSPADMDFAALKSAAARDIALAFGVPPMLLGLPGDNTYANYREANRALWRLTLLPLAGKLLTALRDGLDPWFENGECAVDLDRVPALAEDRERLWKQVAEAGFLSDAEKRQLLGIESLPARAGS